MAEPRRDPETGGRSLAEILREAGVESPTRPGRRRRWDDDDDTGIRQRGEDAEAERAGRAYGRRASDLRVAESAPPRADAAPAAPAAPQRDARPGRPAAADPHTAAIPGVRPSGKPGVPGAGGSGAAATGAAAGATRDRRSEPAAGQRGGEDRRLGNRRAEDRRTERRPDDLRLENRRAEDRRTDERRADDRRADDGGTERRRLSDRRTDQRPPDAAVRTGTRPAGDRRAEEVRAEIPAARESGDGRRGGNARRPAQVADNPATGPIPVVTDDHDDAEAAPQESALAWLRFGGELVIALAAGVGIYFLFTVIWEMVPYLAVVVAPVAVTALVAGVGAYRHKVARGPVGPRLLAVLVFAGTLLTVAPAAGLLAAS